MIVDKVTYGLFNELHTLKEGGICKPRMAILGTTYKCNQNCHYCFFKHMKKDNTTMTKEQMFNVVDQVSDFGIKGLEFCGAGEPLMAPGIEDVFEYAASKGLKLGLLTNGVLFNDRIMEIFLRVGSYVRFSLDTVDKKLYKKIRGADNCEEVMQNIKNASFYKKRFNLSCQVSVKVGVSEEISYKQIQEIMNFIDGKHIHSVQVKNLWDNKGIYYNTKITAIDLKKKIESHGHKFFRKVKFRKQMREKCWITPVQTDIDPYGDVYLCCYYMYRRESHKIGNVFEKPFKDMWGSKEHLERIKKISIHECMKHDCRFMGIMRCARHLFKMSDWYFV